MRLSSSITIAGGFKNWNRVLQSPEPPEHAKNEIRARRDDITNIQRQLNAAIERVQACDIDSEAASAAAGQELVCLYTLKGKHEQTIKELESSQYFTVTADRFTALKVSSHAFKCLSSVYHRKNVGGPISGSSPYEWGSHSGCRLCLFLRQ